MIKRRRQMYFQKSIPIFYELPPPHSAVVKRLLREILKEQIEPLSAEEIKKLKQKRKGRKRVFLTKKDADLINFFLSAPSSLQYRVFLKLNEKLLLLQEVKYEEI